MNAPRALGTATGTGPSFDGQGDTRQGSLLITNLRQVASPAGLEAPLRGEGLRAVDTTADAYIHCDGGKIAAVGPMTDLPEISAETAVLKAEGACAIPGLIDCHTHPAFDGDRLEEFSLKASGVSYETLMAQGGGITTTVRTTRAASAERIRENVQRHRAWMLGFGTTTFEGKSGYGLDVDTELASLRAIAEAGGVPTWLGGHFLPPDYSDADEYIDFTIREVLPQVIGLAEAADIFIGTGGFTLEQGRRYLEACAAAGLTMRIHGDQFGDDGAAGLAAEMAVRSIDHLESTSEYGIERLAASPVVAVLLPTSPLYTGLPLPPARALIDLGGAVALATDFNPGSSFCESLFLVCALSTLMMKMSPAETLAACTVNSAFVLGRSESKGRIAPGFDADIVLFDAPDWRYLSYHLGGNMVSTVIQGGQVVQSRS